MKRLKVMTVVGTRPEIIRLSRGDRGMRSLLRPRARPHRPELGLHAQRDLLPGARDPEARPLPGVAAGKHLGETIGNIIARSYELIERVRPDALLILGDTNSALCAIPAKRLKIPIFHMEAGNRCFDQNVPEEINRKIVDHVSDVNLPYTEHSRRYLLSEGIRKEHVFVTGSPDGGGARPYRRGNRGQPRPRPSWA